MSSPMSSIAPQTVAWEPKRGLVAVRANLNGSMRIDAAHWPNTLPDAESTPPVATPSGTSCLRQRFYPAQLRRLISGALHSLMAGRKHRLTWSGWDRSLPRLYLPIEPLQRLLLEAVDGMTRAEAQSGRAPAGLNIRVELPKGTHGTLMIALEAEGWVCDARFRGALNARWFRQGSQAHLWQRLARQCDLVGGWLSVTDLPGGGTALLINLPTDQPRSLVYSWLSRQAPANEPAHRNATRHAHGLLPVALYVVGRSQAETLEELSAANVRLQSLARTEDYIYRVGQGRWIWLTTAATLPAFMNTLAWQSQRLDQWSCAMEQSAIIDLAHQVERRFRQLLGTRVPPLDLRTQPVVRSAIAAKRPHTRIDQPAQATQPNIMHKRAPAKLHPSKWRYPI